MRYTVKDKLKMVKEHVCEAIPLHENIYCKKENNYCFYTFPILKLTR